MAYQEKCTKCGEYWWTDKAHFCRAKETRSGSPLESVVQPQQDSGAPLNPDVQPGALLPCPFCGSEAVDVLTPFMAGSAKVIECEGCGTEGPWADDETEATKLWNKRAGQKGNTD
jgi:Lar family restriction alleviation protein